MGAYPAQPQFHQRNAFGLDTIQKVADTARKGPTPIMVIFVDNCYGEFTQIEEPLLRRRGPLSRTLYLEVPGGGVPLAAIAR